MAPAQSKPSADEAKTFVVKVDMDGDRLGGIQTTTFASKHLLRQMASNYKGRMNKKLRGSRVISPFSHSISMLYDDPL